MYRTKSEIDKKLCIDCKYCSVHGVFIMCGFYRDKVDGSEVYSAEKSRNNFFLCSGRKWEMDADIVVCENETEVEYLRREDGIESFMPLAREIVKGKKEIFATCGLLDSAIERVKKNQSRVE